LIKWQKEYRNQGLRIVGITYPPTDIAKVNSFVRRRKINYPILLGSKKTKELYNPGDVLPLTVVIDKKGNIKDIIEGILYSDEFDEKIKPLLQP
jgi:peroxiredoxin